MWFEAVCISCLFQQPSSKLFQNINSNFLLSSHSRRGDRNACHWRLRWVHVMLPEFCFNFLVVYLYVTRLCSCLKSSSTISRSAWFFQAEQSPHWIWNFILPHIFYRCYILPSKAIIVPIRSFSEMSNVCSSLNILSPSLLSYSSGYTY